MVHGAQTDVRTERGEQHATALQEEATGHKTETPEVPLIVDTFHPGQVNMQRDEALLQRGQSVVRIYGWRPACVSLGRTQTERDIDTDAARRHGVDVVPRVTGGGAILHNELEVTYAVVLPLDHPGLPGSIRESYRFISTPVLKAFQALDVDVEFGEGTGGRETLCYLREEGISIFAGGRKISGGAQRRTQKAVLQHGTMVLSLDAERTAEILGAPVEAVQKKVTGLDRLGIEASRDDVVDALVQSYRDHFGAIRRVDAFFDDETGTR